MKDTRRLERTVDGCCVTLKSEDGVKYELRFEDPALDYNPLAIEGSLVEIAGELRRIADWVHPPPPFYEVDLEGSWKGPQNRKALQALLDTPLVSAKTWPWDQAIEDKPVDSFPPLGTHCSVCGMPQYDTPGGPSCINGHGGAPPKEG
jgi:hypothetical protein